MYWLGTSRWYPSPFCMLHSVWICFFQVFTPFLLPICLFDFAIHASRCLSFVAWRICGLWVPYSLPFTLSWTLCYLDKSLYLPTELIISFSMTVSLLATDYTISLHHACYNFTSLFISCYPMGLWVDTPAIPTHFFINLLLSRVPWPTFHIFTSFGLCCPTFLLCQPISLLHLSGFLGPFTHSLPLLLSWAFCKILWASLAQLPHIYLLLLFRLIGL